MNWKFWHGKPAVQVVFKPKGTWQRINKESSLGWQEWVYVREDGRILSQVTKYKEDGWFVWKDGAGFGTYLNEDSAKKQAEKIA